MLKMNLLTILFVTFSFFFSTDSYGGPSGRRVPPLTDTECGVYYVQKLSRSVPVFGHTDHIPTKEERDGAEKLFQEVSKSVGGLKGFETKSLETARPLINSLRESAVVGHPESTRWLSQIFLGGLFGMKQDMRVAAAVIGNRAKDFWTEAEENEKSGEKPPTTTFHAYDGIKARKEFEITAKELESATRKFESDMEKAKAKAKPKRKADDKSLFQRLGGFLGFASSPPEFSSIKGLGVSGSKTEDHVPLLESKKGR